MDTISCPACGTSYRLPTGAIPKGGRAVRCQRCGAGWTAHGTAADAAPSPSVTDPGAADDASRPDTPAPTPPAVIVAPPVDALEAPLGAPAAAMPAPATPPVIEGRSEAFRPRLRRPRAPARRPGRGSGHRVLTSPAAAGVAMAGVVLLVAGAYAFRDQVVRLAPDLAGLYGVLGVEVNLRGLDFGALRTYRAQEDSTPVLVVEGLIRNVSSEERPVPALRFGLTGDTPRELYAWSMMPGRAMLAPGEEIEFRSRLPVPPEAAARVNVRFIDRPQAEARL